MDGYRHRAIGPDLRFVDREAGVRVDDFMAGAIVGGGQDRVADERFGARAHHHIGRVDRHAARALDIGGNGLPQFIDAGGRCVAMLAATDGGHARVLDVHRCREVGLADAERHDVLAAADQRVHFGQHDEGILGAKVEGALADVRHGRVPRKVGRVVRRTPCPWLFSVSRAYSTRGKTGSTRPTLIRPATAAAPH